MMIMIRAVFAKALLLLVPLLTSLKTTSALSVHFPSQSAGLGTSTELRAATLPARFPEEPLSDDSVASEFALPDTQVDAVSSDAMNNLQQHQQKQTLSLASSAVIPPSPLETPSPSQDRSHSVIEHSRIPPRSTWLKRLVTPEDKMFMHKISCAVFVLSSAGIVGAGVLSSPSGFFAEIPDFLEYFVYAFSVSSVVQAVSSIDMAQSHRKNDTGARDGFIRSGYNVMTLGFLALWGSPFSPDIFNQPFASEVAFLPLSILSILTNSMDDGKLLGIPAALESRMKTKIRGNMDEINSVQQTIAYVLPLLMPIFASVTTLMVVGALSFEGEIPRKVFMDLHHNNEAGVGEHFYYTIINAMCIGYGNLLVTLRDKRLITKKMEASIMTPINIVAAFSVYHITVPAMMQIFFPTA